MATKMLQTENRSSVIKWRVNKFPPSCRGLVTLAPVSDGGDKSFLQCNKKSDIYKELGQTLIMASPLSTTAVKRHCTDWYEKWALTDHEIYFIKIELDIRKFSNGPFSETKKGFGVGPTPGGSQCTGVSPTFPWKWPRATLSPSFGPFFERIHSYEVKMV